MNLALKHYLDDDWVLLRTTIRWHYIRNQKHAHQLKGGGVMTNRIVRTWYEPLFLWARSRWKSSPDGWQRRFLYRAILNEKG
jgi:hypothetical protein